MDNELQRLEALKYFYSAPHEALFRQDIIAIVLDCSQALMERNRWAQKRGDSVKGVPFIRMGRAVVYKKADVLKYIEDQKALTI